MLSDVKYIRYGAESFLGCRPSRDPERVQQHGPPWAHAVALEMMVQLPLQATKASSHVLQGSRKSSQFHVSLTSSFPVAICGQIACLIVLTVDHCVLSRSS